MRHGEEQGSSGAGKAERQGALPSESSGVPREREEGRASAEEDPLTRDWVELPLTKGKVAKIDRADMLIVGGWKWYATAKRGTLWYAERKASLGSKPQKTVRLHRWILNAPDGMMVDHINGDGLDNRRSNLRLCSPAQNNANRRGRRAGVKSEYLGVWKDDRTAGATWRFRVVAGGKTVGSGSGFLSAADAARAYDKVLVATHGEFALTNFPMGVGRSIYK